MMAFTKHEENPNDSSHEGEKIELSSSDGTSGEVDEVYFADDDPRDPYNWPSTRRWLTIIAVSLMGMISVLATTIIVPAAPQILEEFHVNDNLYGTLLVTMWDLGEGVSPFAAAPLSEKYGRAPIYHTGNVLGLVCTMSAGLSTNISMLIAFRFLGGLFLTAPTLASAITGDVVRKEERGLALAIGMSLRLVAPFAAPISGAYINQDLGWRWIIWILTSSMGAVVVLSFIAVRETYGARILEKKAATLRRETGNTHIRSRFETKVVNANTLVNSVTRPVRLVFDSPIGLLITCYSGLVVGVQYLIITTLTGIMERTYGFSSGSVGLTYIGPCTGFLLGILTYGLTSDRYIKYRKVKEGGKLEPEHRLLHLLIGSFTFPLGLLLYGWTLSNRIFYVVPLIGTGITGFSMLMTMLPTDNYLVDKFELHGASAIGARMIFQALLGATFPLVGPPLYQNLGYGWGNSLLALILAVFIPPLGWLILRKHWKKAA